MSSGNEVKREIEGKLCEATANEKYLYNRVIDLEKRNQKLEKRVKKLKKRKNELKEEVVKLRRTIADDHGASTSDVEAIEESNLVSSPSNLDQELSVISDVNSNTVDEETDAAQVEENREVTNEEVAQGLEFDNSEELDEEALDNPSGTGSSAVPNQCAQCGKRNKTPYQRSSHGRHKRVPRVQEADKIVQVFSAHAGGPLGNQGKVPSLWRRNVFLQLGATHQ